MRHPQIGDTVEVSFKLTVTKIDSEWSDGIRVYGVTEDKLSLGSIPTRYCKEVTNE